MKPRPRPTGSQQPAGRSIGRPALRGHHGLRRAVIATAALALLATTAIGPAAAANGLDISFQAPSTGAFSATLSYTVNREARQIIGLSCTLRRGGELPSGASCGSQVASTKKSTSYRVSLSDLHADAYAFSVTFAKVTAASTFTISPAAASCTVTPYHVTYDGASHVASGSCTGVGGVTLPSSTLDLALTQHTDPGTYTDAWSFSDPSGDYASQSGTVGDTIARRRQTITFGAGSAELAVGGSYIPSANATSGLPVTFSVDGSTGASCSIADGVVQFDAAGECTVNGDQAGDATWEPAPRVQQTFTITRRGQTITFGAAPTDPRVGGSYTPSATATSGLPVTFSIDSATAATCSITDGVVSFDAAGACTVDGNQVGDTSWEPATLVQQTFTIAAAPGPSPNDYTWAPLVHINWFDDPVSPPLPPDPRANQCPPQSLGGGGCVISAFDGSVVNVLDASPSADSLPAGADPSLLRYHWELYKPPGLSGSQYSSAGMSGYHSAVLTILPNSLPSLAGTDAGQDIFWRMKLTITVEGGTASTVSWFRFDYQQSTLTLQMSSDCQRIGHIEGQLCPAEAANGLPATEPT